MLNQIKTNYEHVEFQKGNKALFEEQLILVIKTFKSKLWGILNKPEGTITIDNVTNDTKSIKMKLIGNV